jgi:hypothetical protein
MPNFAFVDVPAPAPRKYGLYSVADVRLATPHELQGVEYYADNCDFAVTKTTDAVCIGSPTRTVTTDGHGTVQALSYPIYTYVECAGINEFAQAKDRAVAIFNKGEERAVEGLLQSLLQADAAAVDLTAGTPSPTLALASLEEYADGIYGGAPTFATTRKALSVVSSSPDLTDQHGNHLETALGSPIFGGKNIATAGPVAAAPGAGNFWLWVFGKVTVRLGAMMVSEPLMVQSASVNEAQTVSITGVPTGGSFTLTFDGQTTAAIAWNANAAAVQSALVALSNIDAGDVTVTGTNPNFTVTFGGQYLYRDVPTMTKTASLTGGTAPNVTIATTATGAVMAGDNSYRVMVTRNVVVDYDCFAAASKAVFPS